MLYIAYLSNYYDNSYSIMLILILHCLIWFNVSFFSKIDIFVLRTYTIHLLTMPLVLFYF